MNEYRQTHKKSKSEMFQFEEHSWALNLLENQSKKDSNIANFNKSKKHENRGFLSRFFNPFQCNARDNEE